MGTFGVSAPLFIEHNHDVYSIHAENEYVEMLLEGGCAGFGLALLGLAGIGLKARRAWIAAPTHADRALVLGASAGIVALAIQVLSDFGLHVPAISLLMVVLCGHLCWLGAERGAATSPAESGFKTPRSWLRVRRPHRSRHPSADADIGNRAARRASAEAYGSGAIGPTEA